MAKPTIVRVETGARIHLGFYGLCSEDERILGGLGLTVDGIGYIVEAEIASNDEIEGCDSDRAYKALTEAKNRLGLKHPVKIRIEKCIPSHVGLGSTTQLTLALYTAIAILNGKSVDEAVKAAKRGPYSGVGVGAFLYGGFIVDAGVSVNAEAKIAQPALRTKFPEDWRVVVIVPETNWRISEGQQEDILMRIPQGGMELCCRAMYALLRMVVPGIVEHDFLLFAKGIEEIQRLTGIYFSAAQGGLFCCPESEKAAESLQELGARGVGQSSWGPLVYGFFSDEASAMAALRVLRDKHDYDNVMVLKPRNKGADISYE